LVFNSTLRIGRYFEQEEVVVGLALQADLQQPVRHLARLHDFGLRGPPGSDLLDPG